MKNLKRFTVLILVFITGCSAQLQLWNTAYVPTGYDFREYAENGFFFTPEGYLGEYDSMGVVNIQFMPKILRAANSTFNPPPGYSLLVTAGGNYLIEKPNTQIIIDEMYKLATEMGADAVIKFEILPSSLNNEGTQINTIMATGFAIKRQ
jgi:hypothetical protein